jgi:hypothetical protein
MFLSINRYDPAKKIERALKAFIANYEVASDIERAEMQLVIAGK